MSARRATYKVAIAGCHRMLARTPQSHNWAAAFAAVPETRIAGVFDKGADTRKAFVACWGDIPAYDDYDRMLREVQPDIVCIATRQTMHAEMAEKAAAAGVRGIHFEKPLATTMAEVDRIEAACRAHRVAVVFGVDRRWWTAAVDLRKRLRDGLVGDVQAVTGYGLPQLIN
ncbi:MAG: Gfo/Idh/MocA family oxidoreductase, partial [Actinobacteria bacterium]|nr:Gfo/Idh/MocA family oxidoreductase [Actinomycetota bacterium]